MMKENDRIKFYKNLGTYEALIRHEMDDVGYMSKTKNITRKSKFLDNETRDKFGRNKKYL